MLKNCIVELVNEEEQGCYDKYKFFSNCSIENTESNIKNFIKNNLTSKRIHLLLRTPSSDDGAVSAILDKHICISFASPQFRNCTFSLSLESTYGANWRCSRNFEKYRFIIISLERSFRFSNSLCISNDIIGGVQVMAALAARGP